MPGPSSINLDTSGGVMKSNADIAKLNHVVGNTNTENRDAAELKRESFPESNAGKGPVKLSKNLIDLLQSNNDPRLPFYATLWEGKIPFIQAVKLPTTTNPTIQKGPPNGYDATTIKQVIPKFLMTEAALSVWETGTTVYDYNAPVTAGMKATRLFPTYVFNYSISQTAIDYYLTAHPLNGATFDLQMEQIHTKFYLAHFMWYDFFEFSNLRRTRYRKLVPPNYPGNFAGGKFLLRLRYPLSEASLNKENYDAAIASKGPDMYTTAVWDK